jgi:hypothetical protein
VLVLDEAQILTSNAMDDLVPTMNQVANPLVILTGTPPRPTDPGEVFAQLRTDALDGESDGTLYRFARDRSSPQIDDGAAPEAGPGQQTDQRKSGCLDSPCRGTGGASDKH